MLEAEDRCQRHPKVHPHLTLVTFSLLLFIYILHYVLEPISCAFPFLSLPVLLLISVQAYSTIPGDLCHFGF